MGKIKVLQFSLAAAMGGRSAYILNLWRHINKDKIHFDFVTFSKSLSCEEELLRQGCIVHHIENHPTEDKQKFIEEFEKVLEHGYDAIEIGTAFWEDTIIEELAKKSGIKKIIIHAHAAGLIKKRASMEVHCKVRESLTEDIATDFWACSKEAGEWIFGDSIAKDKVKILPNTIETERFQFRPEKRMELRRQYNLENKFIIGQVGRLDFVKNHEFTLKLLSKLVQVVPNIELLILGSGDEKERLEKLVLEWGLENYVTFLGRRDNVEDWLQVMDIFVMPSFMEAFPIALIEAETAGLKCICSNRITRDVALTDDVVYLSVDDEELWVNEILKYKDGYERKNGRDAVVKAGYEVLDAIRSLENEYMNFTGGNRLKQKAVIFGKGTYFEKKKQSIEEKYSIEAFLDNAVKPGMVEEKDGVKVYNPQDTGCYAGSAKILLTSIRWIEMWKQLMELGIDEDRIAFASELAPFGDVIEEIFYNEHITILSKDRMLYLKRVGGGLKKVSDEKEYKAIVRGLFAEKNPYIKLISEMPLTPVSKHFGLERGKAIDRFYIEKFLAAHKANIKGTVMEIAEDRYIKMFPENVSESVILHVNGWGKGVIKGNLATGEGIGANCIDCLICTQTIQCIYDIHSVVRNIHKLLKPGGTVMLTASAISQISLYDYKNWGEYWHFTNQSMRELLQEAFSEDQIEVHTYGNMKAAIAFMFGMCQEEMDPADLEYQDEQFPMIAAAVARKV